MASVMGALEMLWVWVYEYVLGPITFTAPLPTSLQLCLSDSVGNKQSLGPLMWGAQEKSEGAHQKNFGRRFAPAFCLPTCKLLPTPLTLTTRSCEFAFTYVCITSCKLSAYTFVMCKINATYLEMGQLLTVNNYLIKYVNWNYSYSYVKLNRPRTWLSQQNE